MTFRTLLIGAAVFALALGAAFGGGTAYGRSSAQPQTQAARPGGQVIQRGAPGGGPGAGGSGPIVGTVASAGGGVLTLTDANNQQVRVTLTDQTRVLKQDTGTLEDLTAGTRVAVQPQGQPAADGAVTASTVQIVPAGAGAAGQGATLIVGGPGGAGGQGGTGGQTGPVVRGGPGGQTGQR